MAKPNLTMAGPHGRQPGQRPGHPLLPDQRQRHLLPAQAAAAGGERRVHARGADRAGAGGQGQGAGPPARRPRRRKRDFPAYLDSNRVPLEPARDDAPAAGRRPLAPVHQRADVPADRSRRGRGRRSSTTATSTARPASQKWVKSGFLNKDIKLPLGTIGSMRTQIEADLLLQNLMLVAEAMGLGAWIHASRQPAGAARRPQVQGPVRPDAGLRLRDAALASRPTSCAGMVPLPKYANLRANPVGLKVNGEQLIKCMCPPYYASMAEAVDEVVGRKFGPDGVYRDHAHVRPNLQGRLRRALPQGGARVQGRGDRVRAGHLHVHLRDPRPLPGARATRSTCRACGSRCTTRTRPTTTGSSATA